MNKPYLVLIFSVLFTVLGLLGGWYAKAQTSRGGAAAHADNDDHGHGQGAGEGTEHAASPTLSNEALKNLRIHVKEIESQTYFKYVSVPAVVMPTPTNAFPIMAPIGGTVGAIGVQQGSVVANGQHLLTLMREALPRPTLTLTEDIIKPVSEQVHDALGALRRVTRGVEVLKTELERVKKFTQTGTQDGLPILPKKNELDLRYEWAKAEQELENTREKLRLHGFSNEQVAEMESGKPLIGFNPQIWRRALQRNGLWPDDAEALFNALPKEDRETAWNVAAIGELAGAGLLSRELLTWLQDDKASTKHFLEIAGMLQQGHTLAQVMALRKLNVLGAIIQYSAPEAATEPGFPDWDVQEIHVKPAQKVAAGAPLITLANSAEMLLKTEPVGGETTAVLKAIQEGSGIEAVPLVTGAGPKLTGLKVLYASSGEHSGTVAYVRVKNEALKTADEGGRGKYRTWQLRAGQRYMLRLPTEKLEDVYVLPSGAVTDDATDRVVFIQDGNSFKTAKVVVLHQDDEVAVISARDSELFPGDSVVQNNAFALGLALKSGSGAVDAHAGHNH